MASRKKKTDTSEKANSDIANRLRRGTYERLLPMDPPIQLFDDVDDYQANADALIEHIWNDYITHLNSRGYADLNVLSESLREGIARLREIVVELDRDGEYLRFIRDSVRAKADRFGEDTTVGQSLLSDEDRGWSSSGGNVCFRPSERVLKEKGINPAKRSPFVQDQYCFSSFLTWRMAVDEVLTSKKHHSDRSRRSRDTLMVISFRQAVLRNVLWQYEAFGDTSEWHKLSKTAQRKLLPKVAPNARWPTYASDALVIIKSGVKGIKAVCVELIKKETPGVTADIGEAWRTPYESLRGKEFIPKGNTDEETKFQEFKMRLEIYAETEKLPWLKVKSSDLSSDHSALN